MGVSECDVKDASQKVFLIAFRRLPEFEARSSIKTWLCGIALRVASEHRRSQASRREVLVDETPNWQRSEPCQLQALEHRERLAELDVVLSQLPIEQRAVFVLFELEEMSGVEIAQLLEVSEGTVRSRLRLARQAFSRITAALQTDAVHMAAGGDR